MERNVSHADFEKLKERLSRIGAAYRNVQAGDRYALSYAPGADFAKACFSIWLGLRPLDEALTRSLLGGSRGREAAA